MPLDLSAGLVAKPSAPVDLSAGLVPAAAAAPQKKGFVRSASDSSSLSLIAAALAHPGDTAATVLDAAKRVVTPGQPERMADNPNPIIAGIGRMVDNTVDNAKQGVKDYRATGFSQQTRRDFGRAVPIVGPLLEEAQQQYDSGDKAGAAGTVLGGAAGIVLGPKLAELPGRIAREIPGIAARAAEGTRAAVVGSALDEPIPGDTVTPRQQYQIAKDQGVNLDAAQATGSPALKMAKKVTSATIGGSPKFEENTNGNIAALEDHAQQLLDGASKTEMSREDFGNLAKARLWDDAEAKRAEVSQLYDQLSKGVGTQQPSTKVIQEQAKRVVADNAAYYANHPDMLKRGAGDAWRIVNNLAAGTKVAEDGTPRPPDTWNDLQKLRTDLMEVTQGPEFIGSRPEGWIKQMTGAVDQAMTDSSSGLTRRDAQKFRDANALYTQLKDSYDNNQHPLYHVIRAQDGLTAADKMMQLKPAMVEQVADAAPELRSLLQRQIVSKLLDPPGNGTFDLVNFPSRFTRTQKEQLGGVLSAKQVEDLHKLSRTARLVYAKDNPSGTATKGIPAAELMSAGAGIATAAHQVVAGEPISAALSVGAPAAWYAGTRAVGAAMTRPGTVARLMETAGPRSMPVRSAGPTVSAGTKAAATAAAVGQARWMALGAAKLEDHAKQDGQAGISSDDIDALKETPEGQQLLIQASDLTPGSAAMRNLVKEIKQRSTE